MKKILSIFAIAALCVVACSKDDDKNNNSNNNNENNGNENGGETEYVAPITIDGEFADWAALDASKLITATCDPDASKTALKVAKIYADKVAIYIYFEFDADQISWEQDVEHVPFHLYVNSDNNDNTGGFNDEQWAGGSFDALFEGFLTDGNQLVSYDPGVYAWNGEDGANTWSWDVDTPLAEGGVCSGAGKGNAYEILLLRDLYPGELSDPFTMGIDIQQGWSTVGYLPNASAEADKVPAFTVASVK